MKTLDNVIEAMERCSIPHYFDCKGCPYEDDDAEVGCRSDDRDADALQYLKELREMTDIPMEYFENGGTSQKLRNTSQISCPKCHSEFVILDDPDGDHQQLIKCQALLQDFYRNDPLTWSELRQMEGKPVWVEGEHGCIWDQKSWVLIRLNDNEDLIICVATNNGHYEFAIGKEDYGKDWQAYRKERV